MRDPRSLARGAARRAYATLQRLRPRPTASDGSSAAEVTARLATLTEQRDHAGAVDLVRREVDALGRDSGFLDQARRSASRAGEPSLQAEMTRAQLAVTPASPAPPAPVWPRRSTRSRGDCVRPTRRGPLRSTPPRSAPPAPARSAPLPAAAAASSTC